MWFAPSFDRTAIFYFTTRLRVRRNRLVHFKEAKGAAITVDMQYTDRSVHEGDAQRAIELVADVMFENPGT